MHTDVTLALPDEAVARLRTAYEQFVRLSTGMDHAFEPPTFEAFLRARLLEQESPLTERAVGRLLSSGEYAWLKRVLDKQLPNTVSALMRDAERFGFALATQCDWTPQQKQEQARQWSRQILVDSGVDAAFAESLASQIASSAVDVRVVEQRMLTPSWRLAESLRQRAYDLMYAVQTERNVVRARTHVGEVKALLGLALEYGSVSADEFERVMAQLAHVRPELFRDEPDDIFSRLAAWFRRLLVYGAPARQ
ncbi:DUF4088 domain-containing protein [Cupriavidus sp. USMAHM13]|uniref:DUF4088 family protein n=1 Tax=Cupriavidus sp. USMAHM13 TaxID=1389192 RepID=UPI0008A6D3CB|nr:DUF4088 family protein [Cupriavidus sp. USMAHM13]AOZ01794.1 DUF4088 domain-containing protein [Cupriavidus sp. USMAHM13]